MVDWLIGWLVDDSLVAWLSVLYSKLQFKLSEGIIGVIYLAASVAYGVGTLFAGQLTDKLVRFPQVVHNREKSMHAYKSSLKA